MGDMANAVVKHARCFYVGSELKNIKKGCRYQTKRPQGPLGRGGHIDRRSKSEFYFALARNDSSQLPIMV